MKKVVPTMQQKVAMKNKLVHLMALAVLRAKRKAEELKKTDEAANPNALTNPT